MPVCNLLSFWRHQHQAQCITKSPSAKDTDGILFTKRCQHLRYLTVMNDHISADLRTNMVAKTAHHVGLVCKTLCAMHVIEHTIQGFTTCMWNLWYCEQVRQGPCRISESAQLILWLDQNGAQTSGYKLTNSCKGQPLIQHLIPQPASTWSSPQKMQAPLNCMTMSGQLH